MFCVIDELNVIVIGFCMNIDCVVGVDCVEDIVEIDGVL